MTPEQIRETQALEATNLALDLDEEMLNDIGTYVTNIFDEDLNSRSTWESQNEEWLKLATQIVEQKTYPWPGAANVKYPLLATAALQFHARAYPALIPDGRVVKSRVFGDDEGNTKREKATRVSEHMSYQLLEENEDWSEDMDRLLYILPIIGTAYKKTYQSATTGNPASPLVLPDDLIINYYAEDYERAIKTHRMYQNENEIYELMAMGHYRQVELNDPSRPASHEGVEDDITGLSAPNRSTHANGLNDVPYTILESHTWYDVDGDGYKEPYIITVEYDSGTVLRIVPRWQAGSIEFDEFGEVIRIKPTEYFTPYGFFPNPESKIYYLGFGSLLGPVNSASNTILNQLLDAGHLSTLQGGFLGKGIRIRGGKLKFKPGEWKVVNTTGDDIRKNVYPLPIKEPSSVLFQLLSLLIESGERLSSVKDIMVGENPGQNQPYATTVAVLEQGMKVFVGIYKRIFRALTKEYRKIYRLNSIYLDQQKYFAFFDSEKVQQVGLEDYNLDNMDIMPNADPSMISESHKMMKAESLLQKKAAGLPINTMEVTKRVLEVEGHEDLDLLMQPDPPSEDPELTFKKQELQAKTQLEYDKLSVDLNNSRFEAFKDYAQAIAHLAKAAATEASIEQQEFKELANAAMQEYKAITDRMSIVEQNLQRQKDQEEKQMREQESEVENANQ